MSDRTGWWNLYRLDGDEPVALHPAEAEFAMPQWVFGLSTYSFLDDGTIACLVYERGFGRLCLLRPDGALDDPGLRWQSFFPASLRGDGQRLVFLAASPHEPAAVVSWTPDTGAEAVLARSSTGAPDPALVSVAEAVTFPTAGGQQAHGLFYAPRNPESQGPEEERPPLLVNVHGGPTAWADPALKLTVQYWTSRGFAYLDLNYRGSTTYGRAYRDALAGAWGVADVEDAAAAVRHLAAAGRVDGNRVAIRGGSAGGYTALCALAFDDTFTAGVSFYGVTDLALLAAETHKFESRYFDGLVGPWPEASDVYRQRSPVHHADRITRPVLLLQGADDPIVPRSQAEHLVEALQRTGTPHAYIAFEGERHGWRQATTIVRALEAELSFYAQVFGFEPADAIEPLALSGSSQTLNRTA